MNIGNTISVGKLLLTALLTNIIYAKYANVNVIIFIFNGNLDKGPFVVNVKLLHIIFGFEFEIISSGKEIPIDIVIKQFSNNIARKIIPLMSMLNKDDNEKKLININGANRNPI